MMLGELSTAENDTVEKKNSTDDKNSNKQMAVKRSIDDKVDNTVLLVDTEMTDLNGSIDEKVNNTIKHVMCSTDKESVECGTDGTVNDTTMEQKCSTDYKEGNNKVLKANKQMTEPACSTHEYVDNKVNVDCSTDDAVNDSTMEQKYSVDDKAGNDKVLKANKQMAEPACSTHENVDNKVNAERGTDDAVNDSTMKEKCSTDEKAGNDKVLKANNQMTEPECTTHKDVDDKVNVECATYDAVDNTTMEEKCSTDDKAGNDKLLKADTQMTEPECSTHADLDNNALHVDNEMVAVKCNADDQEDNRILQVECNTDDIAKQTSETELPDWFKVMIGLTHGMHDGKEIKQAEEIDETIDIHGSTQAITIQTNERLFQLIMKRLHRITRRQRRMCTCTPDFTNFKDSIKRKSTKEKQINSLVENLLEPLVEIDDVNVSCEDVKAVCHKGGVPVLHMRCMSCQSLYRVVTALNSPLFKDGIVRIRDCLEEEMKDKLDIDANITPASINDVKHHLHEQGIITGKDDFLSCGVHPGKLTEVYCFEHSDVCCLTCAEAQHRSCEGVQHIESEEEKRSVIISRAKEYNVRLHTENNEDGNCDIIACCALPNGEIILADMNNKRLKKLNKELKIIDHCDLPDCPRDICYMRDNKLAVTLFDPSIQFVDISGSMELKEKVQLDHDCYGLTFFEDTLFITDPMSVFMYDYDGKEKGRLYHQIAGNHSFCKIAVSDDGEKLYIASREAGLVTIDKEGNLVSKLHKQDVSYVSDLCVAGDGSLLTCNYRKQTVSRVDSKGKLLLGRIAERSDDMYMPQSICYDRCSARLIVGHLHDDYISVLDFR